MNDWENTHKIIEELKNLRTTVRRFGLYFVILTLLPVLWTAFAFFMMGSLLGGVSSGTARGISEALQTAPPVATSSAKLRLQSDQEAKLQALTQEVQRLQKTLNTQAMQMNANPRPVNHPTQIRRPGY